MNGRMCSISLPTITGNLHFDKLSSGRDGTVSVNCKYKNEFQAYYPRLKQMF